MGKLIFRIIHILFLVVGVVLVTSITDANERQKEIVEQSKVIYEQGDLSFIIDGNYLNETPVIHQTVSQNDRIFEFYIYDVAYAINSDGITTFNDGLQIVIEQLEGEDLPYATEVTLTGDNDFSLVIAGYQYYDMPLYVTYDEDHSTLRINRDTIGTNTITHITVTDTVETYISIDVTIDMNNLVAKGWIEDYMSTHDILNVDDIDKLTTVAFLQIDTIPAIIRNLAIYVVIATGLSAAVIFYRRRHLGRGKVNPRLRKDIERLNQKDNVVPREDLK